MGVPVVARAKIPKKRGSHRRSPTPLGEGRISIREVRPEDAGRLREMFARCSQETIYFRFHLPRPTVPEWAIALLVGAEDVHRNDRQSIVAVNGAEIVGHAMYARSPDGREAEVALVVADAWQSAGLGKLLLSGLAVEARRRSIEIFTCVSLGENRRVLALARAVFSEVRSRPEGGSWLLRLTLSSLRPGAIWAHRAETSA